jgi:hypothetical protein
MSSEPVEIISPNNVLANAMLRSVDMVRPRLQATNPDRVAFCVGTQINGARRSCLPKPPSAPSTWTRSSGSAPWTTHPTTFA